MKSRLEPAIQFPNLLSNSVFYFMVFIVPFPLWPLEPYHLEPLLFYVSTLHIPIYLVPLFPARQSLYTWVLSKFACLVHIPHAIDWIVCPFKMHKVFTHTISVFSNETCRQAMQFMWGHKARFLILWRLWPYKKRRDSRDLSLSLSTHRWKAMWGHSIKTILCKPGKSPHHKQTLIAPCCWTSGLQNCEKIIFCCLNQQVCAILLWQLKLANTLPLLQILSDHHHFPSSILMAFYLYLYYIIYQFLALITVI